MRKKEKLDRKRVGSIVLHTCPVCGKIFIPAAYHIYRERNRSNGRLVCSYPCENVTRKEKA